ncbi:hypothetical protein EVAR_95453_1 [Eumeta japonica]|uniref:Uncharacterized protein n=1 Tax=Eumeta variegata TaxID=151549 RepID=A0A4C1UIN1_EUMVA|nr:hypothetical protein EVAR_95453_1 [Eumeta japonica]
MFRLLYCSTSFTSDNCDGCTNSAAMCRRRIRLHIRAAYITFERAWPCTSHISRMSVRSWVIRDLNDHKSGSENVLLPHVWASSRSEYDPDGPSGSGPLAGVHFVGSHLSSIQLTRHYPWVGGGVLNSLGRGLVHRRNVPQKFMETLAGDVMHPESDALDEVLNGFDTDVTSHYDI